MAHTWDRAAVRWLVERQHKRTASEDRSKLAALAPYFGGRELASLTYDDLEAFAQAFSVGRSPATVNRYLALVRAILRRAVHVWRWFDAAPRVELLPEPRRRVRWIEPAQARQLLDELPPHQRDLVLFALATRLRQSNVVRLRWEQVDVLRAHAWVNADDSKSGRALSVPLNQTAVEALLRQAGKHRERVWTFRGRPLESANTRAWRQALKRAGIRNFRWHDLRHTWASWHVQRGTPLYVVQDLGGWSTEQMVRRYAHLAPSQYAKHAATLDGVL